MFHKIYVPLSEKRPSGGSFSSFKIPSQKDPGLRLRMKPEEQDEESKENVDRSAEPEEEKRLSQSINGSMSMDIP